MQVIHPFPARMAPEIARNVITALEPGSRLLDPMCGSGTVIRSAVESGVHALGSDIDPMAVLMSSVWVDPPDGFRLLHDAHVIADRARKYGDQEIELDWHDEETRSFVSYWFGARQRRELSQLASCIWATRLPTRKALMVALSRIIITKDRGASLARDVSHSRPHRVATESDYDVYDSFLKSARALAARLNKDAVRATGSVRQADGRDLSWLEDRSVDCVVTSPPYLNAIDYLRGHRLALVWLGYSYRETALIRSNSVGCERGLSDLDIDVSRYVAPVDGASLPDRQMRWIARYAADASALVQELARVMRPGGQLVLVVGNSFLRGCRVDNAGIFSDLMVGRGMHVMAVEREIPARRRYLPTPQSGNALANRMRTEVVLTARTSA
jgi:hypothetical protein